MEICAQKQRSLPEICKFQHKSAGIRDGRKRANSEIFYGVSEKEPKCIFKGIGIGTLGLELLACVETNYWGAGVQVLNSRTVVLKFEHASQSPAELVKKIDCWTQPLEFLI